MSTESQVLRARFCSLAVSIGLVLAAGSSAAQAQAAGKASAPARSQASTAPAQARSMKIQEVKSPGGISAWLVESHNVPLLALRFAFEGGSAQDPAGREGLANFLTAMMDEGAGDLDATSFQERMEEIAMRMSFEDGRDHLYGNFETLTVNRDKAAELFRLAVNKPRFDAMAVERIKKQILASLAFSARDPNRVASKAWNAKAFPNHPYGRPAEGTVETVTAIADADLKAYHGKVFAKSTLRVVAVGDIDAKTLGALLDKVFGELPANAQLAAVPEVAVKGSGLDVIDMPVPQSVAIFGAAGLKRKDPDFMPAFVVNQILGGGGFASRLMEEVREKRGLAYSVYSNLYPYQHGAVFIGNVATKNEAVGQSLEVIESELRRLAEQGPTQEELESAKSYLTGAYALRFESSSGIANQLLWIQIEDLGIDYVGKRNAIVEAVSLDDIKRVAKRLIEADRLITTIVGKPVAAKGKEVPG